MKPLSEQQIITNLQQYDDTSARYYAAWWLGKMRSKHPEAIPLLMNCLTDHMTNDQDQERRGVALNAIRALGLLRDRNAIPSLITLLSSNDYTIREEAARSLGALRAEEAVQPIGLLLKGGLDTAGSEQPSSPQLKEPCEAFLEALGEIGLNTTEIVELIKPFTHHHRPLIRAAACRALLQLTQNVVWANELHELLRHPEPLVRRGALLDLGATGWLDALPHIKTATVEASLKLVALRGLAEQNEAIDVLNAMDELL